MRIIITSHPTGLFNRDDKTVREFTDDSGTYEEAIRHVEDLIGIGHDFQCRVTDETREYVDAVLERTSNPFNYR